MKPQTCSGCGWYFSTEGARGVRGECLAKTESVGLRLCRLAVRATTPACLLYCAPDKPAKDAPGEVTP